MKKEITVQAKTVEEAVKNGAAQLGTDENGVVYEVIEEPKRGFLGMGSTPATVKVMYVFKPLEAARSFAQTLIKDLCLDAEVVIHDDGSGEALMEITGADAGTLIGHHGDTLDAFQYLVNLAANKKGLELIGELKNKAKYPFLTRKSDYSLSGTAKKVFAVDTLSCRLYSLFTDSRVNEFATEITQK